MNCIFVFRQITLVNILTPSTLWDRNAPEQAREMNTSRVAKKKCRRRKRKPHTWKHGNDHQWSYKSKSVPYFFWTLVPELLGASSPRSAKPRKKFSHSVPWRHSYHSSKNIYIPKKPVPWRYSSKTSVSRFFLYPRSAKPRNCFFHSVPWYHSYHSAK